jgi:di- and tripeptidase
MPRLREREEDIDVEGEGDVMLYALSKLVAVPTVSDDVHREKSVALLARRAATDL